MVYRRTWVTIISGFFEPLFYLFSLGSASATTSAGQRREVRRVHCARPAGIRDDGAIFDSTINVFFKLRYGKVYDAMLADAARPDRRRGRRDRWPSSAACSTRPDSSSPLRHSGWSIRGGACSRCRRRS